MTPINTDSINEKLILLQESINLLEELANRKDLNQDKIAISAAMFQITIGIELILDIGNHILSENFQDSAKTYREVIIKLGEHSIVDKDFAKENEPMADFRNKLIHQYVKIDLDLVANYTKKAPKIFKKFAKSYVEFLENL